MVDHEVHHLEKLVMINFRTRVGLCHCIRRHRLQQSSSHIGPHSSTCSTRFRPFCFVAYRPRSAWSYPPAGGPSIPVGRTVYPDSHLLQPASPPACLSCHPATPRELLWWSSMRPVFYPLDAFALPTTCVT